MTIRKSIYFDHQATTPVHPEVVDRMAPYASVAFGNPHSSDHVLGWNSARAVETAAEQVGRLIGADSDEIVFTSGATESNNLALLGLRRGVAARQRRRILVSAIEHKCVLAACRALQDHYGFTIEIIPVDRQGFIELSALEAALGDDVLAVSVILVNNEIGTIQRIEEISELARRCGAIVHSDAAQAPIAMSVSMTVEHTDVLSLSAHKMYGPKGIGITYVARELQKQIEPLIYGGGQQQGLRSGTLPVPLCVGMGAAADLFLREDIQVKRAQLIRRRDAFVQGLKRLAFPISVNGAREDARHPGNANIAFHGFSAHDILGTLQPHLAASTGSACTTGIPEPSHVLRAIGLGDEDAESSIRFSLGFDTSDDDVNEAIGLVESALHRLARTGLPRTA